MIATFNRLKEAGMEARLAEVMAEEMDNISTDSAATKEDVTEVRNDVKIMELELRKDMKIMELELKGFIVKSLITGFGAMTTILGSVMFFVN
jgi:hypothetical protein